MIDDQFFSVISAASMWTGSLLVSSVKALLPHYIRLLFVPHQVLGWEWIPPTKNTDVTPIPCNWWIYTHMVKRNIYIYISYVNQGMVGKKFLTLKKRVCSVPPPPPFYSPVPWCSAALWPKTKEGPHTLTSREIQRTGTHVADGHANCWRGKCSADKLCGIIWLCRTEEEAGISWGLEAGIGSDERHGVLGLPESPNKTRLWSIS